MSESARALGALVRASGPLLERYLVGFDDSNRTRQAPGLPNHVSWTLGHCALYMHRAAGRLEGSDRPLPIEDFVTGDGRAGGPERFDTESVAFASRPVDDAAIYPRLERAREVFRAAVERLARAAEGMEGDPCDRARSLTWGASRAEVTRAELVGRMIFHNGTHQGQIADLRRALGMKGILG